MRNYIAEFTMHLINEQTLWSFGSIDFYNDSGWATLTHPETHAQNFES